jgi:hypothetical protein
MSLKLRSKLQLLGQKAELQRQFKTEEQTATARLKSRVAMKRKRPNTEEQLQLLGQKTELR